MGQHAGTVDHGRVDDLSFAGPFTLPERGQDPRDEEHRTATEVAYQVQRHNGFVIGGPYRFQDPGDGQVVDVVAGLRSQWTVLAPSGHPAVHDPAIHGAGVLGPHPESLGDAGPVTLDEDISALHQGENTRAVAG